MTFNLNTHDIQRLVIALIMYHVYNKDSVITKDDVDRISAKLTELNNMCTKENNYTLKITVE